MKAIVAVDEKWGIGKDGDLLVPAEMKLGVRKLLTLKIGRAHV